MKTYFKRFQYFVAVVLASIAACGGLFAMAPSLVSAAIPGDPAPATGTFDELNSASEQAIIWTSFINGAPGRGGFIGCFVGEDSVSASDIAAGKWLADSTKKFGHHIETNGDANMSCDNENGWFDHLLDVAGIEDSRLSDATLVFRLNDQGTDTASDDTYSQITDSPTSTERLRVLLAGKLFGGVSNIPSSVPPQVNYSILLSNFKNSHGCEATLAPTDPDGLALVEHRADIYEFNAATKTVEKVIYSYSDKEGIGIGHGTSITDEGNDQEASCNTIKDVLEKESTAQGMADYYAATGNGDTSPGATTGSDDPTLQCGTKLNPLNWFICPAVKGINSLVSSLDNAINSLLTVDQIEIFGERDPATGQLQLKESSTGYYTAWQAFRNIALGVLVAAALIMIIAQAFGFELLDAYTIKKILPRLIISIIGIALSWELMRFFVGFTNDLGLGIRQLIYSPFSNFENGALELGGGATVLVTLLTGGALAALGILGLLSFGVTALMAVFIAFMVLILRQLIIVILILFAPVAIACYILPNTNGVWKLWYESFTKAMLMFPIIVAFLAVGRVFALVATAEDGGDGPSAVNQLIGFAAYVLPYFLIPLTFRFAGGALRTIGGFSNDRGKGGFDRLKKYRQGQYQQHGARKVDDAGKRALQKRANAADRLKEMSATQVMAGRRGSKAVNWARRGALGYGAGAIGGYNIEGLMSAKREATKKEFNQQQENGRDEELRGLSVNKSWALRQKQATKNADGTWSDGQWRMNGDTREFKTLGGAWVNEGHVDAGHKRWGKDTFMQQHVLAYEGRKALGEGEAAMDSYNRNYHNIAQGEGSWAMTDSEAGGAWQGAAFENQGLNLHNKAVDWRTGEYTNSSGGFDMTKGLKYAKEAYNGKGSYQLSQLSPAAIQAMSNVYDNFEAAATNPGADAATVANAREGQRMLTAVSENFMHELGMGPGTVLPGTGGTATPSGAPSTVGRRQASVQGSAAVAEKVVKFAQKTGVHNPNVPRIPIDPQK